jgi:hypothetical protein
MAGSSWGVRLGWARVGKPGKIIPVTASITSIIISLFIVKRVVKIAL